MEDNKVEELDKETIELEREKDLNEKRLELLPLKKARFLIAIGKKEEGAEDLSTPCETIRHVINRICISNSSKDTVWEDSVVTDKFNSWKQPEFDLNKYLGCVKWIYLVYYGLRSDFLLFSGIDRAMEYVMAHARNFTDPETNMFKFSEQGDKDALDAPALDEMDEELPTDTPYAAAINECITQLSSNQSLESMEGVFQRLNVNITYLILLMMRRSIKTKEEFHNAFSKPQTHAHYNKLCPHPLHSELPVISERLNEDLITVFEFSSLKYLVMMAIIQCEDERTKDILKVTCLQHLEWTGLVFPRMFFKVATLYNIEIEEFWDKISTKFTLDSMFELSDLYYHQYVVTKEDPSKSFKLFPFCRLFGSDYHRGMSYRTHFVICYILAYLHDLHFGLDKSSARLAHWTKNKNFAHLLEPITKCSVALHEKYFKQT